MRYGLFLGCNTPAIRPDVEQAIRLSMSRLGADLVDLEGYVCCPGFGTFPSTDEKAQLAVNAWNLSLGEERGCDLVAQCGSCYSSLRLGRHLLDNEERRGEVNEVLNKADRSYNATNTIRHITDVLYYDVGIEKIKATIEKPLEGMHCVVQYPCHTLYPSDVVGFEPDKKPPHILRELVEALGATVDTYSHEYRCCGGAGGFAKSDPAAAQGFLKDKLDAIKAETKAELIVTTCITCLMWMDKQQVTLSSEDEEYSIPIFDYNQLLALCQGFDAKQVAAITTIPRDEVIEKI